MLGKILHDLNPAPGQGHSYREKEPDNIQVFSQHTETVLHPVHCHFQELIFMIQSESVNFCFCTSTPLVELHSVINLNYAHHL
jgi:hypothetical protein